MFAKPFLFLCRFCLLTATLSSVAFAIEVHELKTPQGFKVWFTPDKSVPVISVSFTFDNAGSTQDPKGLEGLADITMAMLMEGAGDLDANAFQDKIAAIGARIGFSENLDQISGGFSTTLRMKSEAVKLFQDILYRPKFDQSRLDLLKTQLRPQIIEAKKQPGYKLNKLFRNTIYRDHPYQYSGEATLESVDAITISDIRKFHKTKLAKSNIIIGVCGNLSTKEVMTLVDSLFGNLPKNATTKDIPKVQLNLEPKTYVELKETLPQSQGFTVFEGLDYKHKDFWKLRLAISIFGQGFKGRLMQSIREEKGLVYSIHSFPSITDKVALVNTSFGTANAKVQDTLDALATELNLFADKGITASELKEAKDSAIGSYILGLSSTGAVASALSGLQKIGYPITYINDRSRMINAITLEDMNTFIKVYFSKHAKHMSTFLVGNPNLTGEFTQTSTDEDGLASEPDTPKKDKEAPKKDETPKKTA